MALTVASHGGEYPDTMPQVLIATDAEGRCLTYVSTNESELAPEMRPQDPTFEAAGWKFKTAEHRDGVPMAIIGTDPEGRSGTYVAITEAGRVLDSVAFELVKPD